MNILLGEIVLESASILLHEGFMLGSFPQIVQSQVGGLVENALRGLASRMVGPDEQGRVGGASQSMASLAAILGPLLGGVLYTQWGHFETYASGALIIILAIASVVMAVPALRRR